MKTLLTQFSIRDLETTSSELVRNAFALHPDLPAANLIEPIISLADAEFLEQLDRVLRAKHFLHVIRLERSKDRKESREAEWLFPEIREAALALPLRIPVGNGKTVARSDMKFADTGRFLKILDTQLRKHKEQQRAAIRTIRRLWPRSERALRMTLVEVDRTKAKNAGLVD